MIPPKERNNLGVVNLFYGNPVELPSSEGK
jgi:hypothetical protein